MMAGGQREKSVTNVETAPKNNTVGVKGRGAGVILMRITHPRYTLLLRIRGLEFDVNIACIRVLVYR